MLKVSVLGIFDVDSMSHVNRYFAIIYFLIGLACSAILLVGCGGSGGSEGASSPEPFTFTKTPVNASIELPPNNPISDLTSLVTATSAGINTPDTQGQVVIDLFNNGPQYADARDSQDRLVLASFVSSDNRIISPASTAQALIFVALSGIVQPGDASAQMLELVPGLPGFDAVVSEVEAQITLNGYISLSSGNLRSSIQAIIDSFSPSANGLRAIGESDAYSTQGVIGEPTSNSGLFLDTLIDGQFTIQNNYLRRVSGYIRRISYKIKTPDGQAVETAVNEPYAPVAIASPDKYAGIVATVNSAFTGNIAWTPTINGPIKTPLNPSNASETRYELLTFGAGLGVGDFSKLTPEMVEEYEINLLKTLFLDYIFPAVINIALPLKGDSIKEFAEFAGRDVIVIDTLNILRSTAPDLLNLLKQGSFSEALKLAYTTGVTSNTAVPLAAHLFLEYGPDSVYDNAGDMSEGISKILKAMGYAEIFASASELAILTHDISESNSADAFYITVTGGKVTLIPDELLKCAVDSVNLTVHDPNADPFAIYKYEWTVNEGFEVESDGDTTSDSENGILVTFDPDVTVRSVEGEVGKANVNCKVTRVDTTPDQQIDTDTTVIEFVPRPEVSQSTTNPLAQGETVTFNASYIGPHSVQWKYVNETPELGSINRTLQGTSPDCIFTANSGQGTAIIKAEMHIQKDGHDFLACSATKTIAVGDGLKVDFHTDWTTGAGNDFTGVAVQYCTAWAFAGAGTYTLKADGVPVKSWQYPGDLPETTPAFTGIRLKRRGGEGEGNWWVELGTAVRNDFPTVNDANLWASTAAGEFWDTGSPKTYTLHHTPSEI